MRIKVESVAIPEGSTIGFAIGTTDDGTVEAIFGGDARMMADIREALVEGAEVVADVPEWAVIAMREKRFR